MTLREWGQVISFMWKMWTCDHCWHAERGPASGVLRLKCCRCTALRYPMLEEI
jgi:hypothetical protein